MLRLPDSVGDQEHEIGQGTVLGSRTRLPLRSAPIDVRVHEEEHGHLGRRDCLRGATNTEAAEFCHPSEAPSPGGNCDGECEPVHV